MIPRVMLAVAHATGKASFARQVKGHDPNEKGYPGPLGWRLGVRLTTLPCTNNCYVGGRPRPSRDVELMIMTMIR